MGQPLITRYRAQMDFSDLKDADRHEIVAAAKQAGPTSQLIINSVPMQTSLASMVTKDQTLTQANLTVTNDKSKLKTDTAAEAADRNALDGEIRTFVTLAEGGAKSAADLQGAGLDPLPPRATKTLPPDMPESIDTTYPAKGHGKAKVSVHETGKTRRQYAAQWSPDPATATSWAQLGVGGGKTRMVTGASGTKVWVRFATVRGQQQSDWCTPVLVTIP